MRDLRRVFRDFLHRPASTIAVVVTLAVGIGMNALVFGVIDAVLLKPLARYTPGQLVRLATARKDSRDSPRFTLAYADYRDVARDARTLTHVTAIGLAEVVVQSGDLRSQNLTEIVSGDYFTALGIAPRAGRMLTARDNDAAAAPAAVVSASLANQLTPSAEDALGRAIIVNGNPFTIVGVAPDDFAGTFIGVRIDVWVPLETSNQFFAQDWRTSRTQNVLNLIARLSPGITTAAAQAELDTLAAQISQADPINRKDLRLLATPGTLLRGPQRGSAIALATLLAVLVLLLLLIVCANVASLLLAQGVGRRRDLAIRLALGASRGRVIQATLLESAILCTCAGVLGLVLAIGGFRLLSRVKILPTLTIDLGLEMSLGVLVASLALVVVTIVAAGILPAWDAARTDCRRVLNQGAEPLFASRGALSLRRLIVVMQVAASVLLLSAAGMFIRSLSDARALDLGFDAEHAMAIDINLTRYGLSPAEGHRLYEELGRRLHASADVTAVAFSNGAPVEPSTPLVDILLESVTLAPGQTAPRATRSWASEEYFDALGIAIRRGRGFTNQDHESSPPVAIVNETMAQRLWNGDALGRQFRTSEETRPIQVVGIAQDSVYRALGEAPQSHIYVPFAQTAGRSTTLIVRARTNPQSLIPVVQHELERLPTPLDGFYPRTLRDQLDIMVLPSGIAATSAAALGAMALILAVLGVYGVIARAAREDKRNFAIRVMVGAEPYRLRRLVFKDAIRLVAPGILLGTVASTIAGYLARGMIYGNSGTDGLSTAVAVAALIFAAFFASYSVAREAINTDPAEVVRRA